MICAAAGTHPTDVVQWLARAPGVWPQLLDEPTVRKLLDGLYESKVAAEAWRVDQFPDLSPPRDDSPCRLPGPGAAHRRAARRTDPLGALGPDRDDLRRVRSWSRMKFATCTASAGLPRWLPAFAPWRCRGPRPMSRMARAYRTPARPRRRDLDRSPRSANRLSRGREPDELRLPGRPPEDFGGGEFPDLSCRSLRRADQAYLTPSTRALLERRDGSEYEFPSSQAILDYATHRLLWSWYSRDREAQEREPGQDGKGTDHGPS